VTLADELRAMLDKAERYIASAELLHAQGDYDSAISRLYYAMFYCAEALLTAEGLAYSSHKAVIAAFGQHFAKTGKLPSALHQWLREGFEKRQISDYDFVLTVSEDDVIDLSGKARQFIIATANFLKDREHL
jgi:uncharacterized protein (UPF0332 family)